MNKILRNPATLIVGIGLFAYGGYKFAELAVIPRVSKLMGK